MSETVKITHTIGAEFSLCTTTVVGRHLESVSPEVESEQGDSAHCMCYK